MTTLPEDVRHSIAEIVNYDYANEEADYVREDEPEGHVFEHLKRVSDWLQSADSQPRVELPHEQFRAEDIERLGWLILYWSRIPAQNQDAIDQFIEAIGNSSVPEACGVVGASITDEEED